MVRVVGQRQPLPIDQPAAELRHQAEVPPRAQDEQRDHRHPHARRPAVAARPVAAAVRDRPQPRQSDEEDRGQADEAALPERAGDRPRLDAAGDVDLRRDGDQETEREPRRRGALAAAGQRRSRRPPEPARHAGREPDDGEQRQRRPEHEPVLGRREHAEGVRREPVQLAHDQARGERIAVQGQVGQELRRVADRERREPRDRMSGEAPSRRAERVLRRHATTPGPNRAPAPATISRSCSRTITISAAVAPSATPPPIDQRSRTCSHDEEEGRHREGLAGVRHRRRDVHVEDQRRAEPDGERGRERAAAQAEAVRHRPAQHDREPAVDRRAERDGAHVGRSVAVANAAARHADPTSASATA